MGQGQLEGNTEKKMDNKVILRVDMDCEACKHKVRKVLKSFPGVENIDLDMDEQKVTIKGNVDAWKVCEALKKKCGKRTMLLYPQFSKEEERKAKEDSIINSVNKIVDSITDLLTPKPADTEVELKVRMHCGACAKKIKRILLRMEGTMDVEVEMVSDKVVVKGRGLDAEALCERVKESGKACEVLSVKKEEKAQEKKKGEKKEEKKVEKKEKEEPKAEEKEEKKDTKQGKQKEEKKGGNKEEKKGEKKPEEKNGGNKAEKKGEKKPEKKEDEEAERKEKNEDKEEEKKEESKESTKAEDKIEGKNGSKEGSKVEKEAKKPADEGGGQQGGGESDVKKFMYTPYQSVPEYVYPPQIFSDENPNACSVM